MNTPKKTLVAELTAALGPIIHAQPGAAEALPKPVEKAIEQLAETVLRWRGRQDAVGTRSPKHSSSESDDLMRLMNQQFADGADNLPPPIVAFSNSQPTDEEPPVKQRWRRL